MYGTGSFFTRYGRCAKRFRFQKLHQTLQQIDACAVTLVVQRPGTGDVKSSLHNEVISHCLVTNFE
jgi:hypothetical protein